MGLVIVPSPLRLLKLVIFYYGYLSFRLGESSSGMSSKNEELVI